MNEEKNSKERLKNIPNRIFLDSNVLQYIHKYGEELFDNKKISKDTDNIKNIKSLRNILFIGKRGNLELVLSKNSLQEIKAKKDFQYKQWADEVFYYWLNRTKLYEKGETFLGEGEKVLKNINEKEFDYLSDDDKELVFDAIRLECDGFLTMDKKLWTKKDHIEKNLPIKILQPFEFWKLMKSYL